jgi:Outer membrane protein beta-barrel domain
MMHLAIKLSGTHKFTFLFFSGEGFMKRFCIVLFVCLIFCASAFPQDRGVIQCDSTFNRVPSWTAPGSANLVEYLSCGQMVSTTGLDRGYVRIQIGGHIAYVEAKYVRMTPTREPWPSRTPAPRSSESTIPTAEIFVGYSYLNFTTNGLADSRQNAKGWEASVSGNFNKWFALELDLSGYYKNYSYYTGNAFEFPNVYTVSYYRDYSYLAGPRVNYGPVFVHALFGGDHLSGSALGTSSAQTGFAGALGGGIQIPMDNRFAFRVGADYVFSEHNMIGGASDTRNNFRASAGIVFNLGNKSIR